MAYSAAAMYAGAAAVSILESLTPGGPGFSVVPALGALPIAAALAYLGPRIPLPLLASAGPIGAALIAYSLSTTQGSGDGAVLYLWPVLWVAFFFGRAASVCIVVWVGLVHGIALIAMPEGLGYFDRWLDVMMSVVVVAAVVEALSERSRRLFARLEDEARVDKLTGVLNRRGFDEGMEAVLERCRREHVSVAAVEFDIDHFKSINDEWGHEVGDRVLAHLGAVLREQTRGGDVAARIGGEEFFSLLCGAGADDARKYAERVRAAFSRTSGRGLPPVTVSAGVTAVQAPVDPETLLQDADTALYAAKHAGRDRAVVYGLPPQGRPESKLVA